MDLASLLFHEDKRVKEEKKAISQEEKEPLYIKAELVIPKVVISNDNFIYFDATLALGILPKM